MDHPMHPDTSRELHEKRRELAPGPHAAFRAIGTMNRFGTKTAGG